MFDDPSQGAEERMSDALSCVLMIAALIAVVVIGAIILILKLV